MSKFIFWGFKRQFEIYEPIAGIVQNNCCIVLFPGLLGIQTLDGNTTVFKQSGNDGGQRLLLRSPKLAFIIFQLSVSAS